MSSRASAARAARTLTGHAVRRLTDESTNVHCTPLRRPEPRFGSARSYEDRQGIGGRPMVRPRRPSHRRRARRRCPARVRRRRLWGRRQPGRGAAQGGDQEADRARLPGRGDQEHHPHRGRGPARRRRRRRERRLSGRHPRLPAARGDPGRQRRLARRHRRRRAHGSAAARADPAHRRRGHSGGDVDRARLAAADRRPCPPRGSGGGGRRGASARLAAGPAGRREGRVHARRRNRRARDRRRRAPFAERPDRVQGGPELRHAGRRMGGEVR